MLSKLKGVSYYSQPKLTPSKQGEVVLLKIDEKSEYDNKPIVCYQQ